MPQIVITGSDLSAPAIASASAGLDNLAARGEALSRTLGTTTTALGRVNTGLAALDMASRAAFASIDSLGGVLDASLAGMDKFAASADRAGAGLDAAASGMSAYVKAIGELDAADTTGSKGMAGLVDSSRALNVALGDTTIIVNSYTDALARLDAAQLAAAASMERLSAAQVTGGAASVGSTISRDVGGSPALRIGGLGQTEGGRISGSAGGVSGSFLPAGVSGGVLAGGVLAAGAAVIGFKATQDASTFWSALAQAAAQSGTLQNPAQMKTFGQGILSYASSGKSPYSAATLAAGAEIPLASGYSPQTVLAMLPGLANLAAQNKAPNLMNVDAVVTGLATAMGINPKTATGAQMTTATDFISKAEQLTKAAPGAFTTALPTVLGALPGSGVSVEDATALVLKMGTVAANPGLRQSSTSVRQLISGLDIKPTAGAVTEANQLGFAIGPGSAAVYGGILPQLQALQTATAGNPGSLAKILTQRNALTAFNDINAGGGLSQAADYAQQLNNAGGTGQSAFNQLSQGTAQQWTQTMDRLNGDMVSLGTTLNETVVPAMIKGANAILGGMEAAATTLENWGKQTPTNPAGGTIGDTLTKLLTPGGAGGGNLTKAQDMAARGTPDTGFFPALGNAVDSFMSGVGINSPTKQHPMYGPVQAAVNATGVAGNAVDQFMAGVGINFPTAQHPLYGPVQALVNATGPIGNTIAGGSTPWATPVESATAPVSGFVPSGGPAARARDAITQQAAATAAQAAAAQRGYNLGTEPAGYYVGPASRARGQITQQGGTDALNTFLAAQQAPSGKALVSQDQGTVRTLLGQGASAADLTAALKQLHTDLTSSGMNAAQQATAYSPSNLAVSKAIRGYTATSYQGAADTAQQNLVDAQSAGASPAAQQKLFDQQMNAQYSALQYGSPASKQPLKTLAELKKQQSIGDFGYTKQTLTGTLGDITDLGQTDLAAGNYAGAAAQGTAANQFLARNRAALQLTPAQLQSQTAANNRTFQAPELQDKLAQLTTQLATTFDPSKRAAIEGQITGISGANRQTLSLSPSALTALQKGFDTSNAQLADKNLSNAVSIAGMSNNPQALVAAQRAQLQEQIQNAGALGLSPSDIAVLKATFAKEQFQPLLDAGTQNVSAAKSNIAYVAALGGTVAQQDATFNSYITAERQNIADMVKAGTMTKAQAATALQGVGTESITHASTDALTAANLNVTAAQQNMTYVATLGETVAQQDTSFKSYIAALTAQVAAQHLSGQALINANQNITNLTAQHTLADRTTAANTALTTTQLVSQRVGLLGGSQAQQDAAFAVQIAAERRQTALLPIDQQGNANLKTGNEVLQYNNDKALTASTNNLDAAKSNMAYVAALGDTVTQQDAAFNTYITAERDNIAAMVKAGTMTKAQAATALKGVDTESITHASTDMLNASSQNLDAAKANMTYVTALGQTQAQQDASFKTYIAAERQDIIDQQTAGKMTPGQAATAQMGVDTEVVNYGNAQATTNAQNMVTAADQTYQAGQLMHDTPGQLKVLYDGYLQAERALFTAQGLTGQALINALQGVTNQGLTLSNDQATADAQSAVDIAKNNLDLASLNKNNTGQIKTDQDAYITAQKALFAAEGLSGPQLAAAMGGLGVQSGQYAQDDAATQRQNLSDLITLAQLDHSPAGIRNAQNNLLSFDTASGQMTPTQLAIEKAQNQAGMLGMLPTQSLIRQVQQPLQNALAGYGSTSVSLATGNAAASGQAQLIRNLEEQIKQQAAMISALNALLGNGQTTNRLQQQTVQAIYATAPSTAPTAPNTTSAPPRRKSSAA